MLRFVPAFILGALVFHQLAWLPGWSWVVASGVLGAALLPSRQARPLAAFMLGFAWSHGHALVTAPPRLPDDDGVMRLQIEARVVSLVGRSGPTARFLVESSSPAAHAGAPGPWRLRLSWHDAPPDIRPGDLWRLPVRVRPAHGYASPGAWDYEGWLYWQGVRYAGYVDPKLTVERLERGTCCRLTGIRARLAAAIDAQPLSAFARGVIRALVVGDAGGLTPRARALFQATGTSHLMAISGLHIGLMAGLGLVGVAAAWRRVPALCARIPAGVAGAAAGLIAALGYALLAGLSLPTQRALIMLLLFTLGLLLRRDSGSLHALALAALGVLSWHPPSVISAGFWLSFGAVFVILLVTRAGVPTNRLRIAVKIQFAVSLALWPMLAAFGLPISAFGPVVNLLLIPVFGLLIVPVSLLGAALLVTLPVLGMPLLEVLGQGLDWVALGLEVAARLSGGERSAAVLSGFELAALGLAIGLLLAPHGFPLRPLGFGLILMPWLPTPAQPGAGGFELHVLDVGQGLSSVVLTRRHTLVFDTGPAYPSGFSAADAVLLPFLASRRRTSVDRLVLSHGDIDHAGGTDEVLDRLAVDDRVSGEPPRLKLRARRCVAGEVWFWDGVRFEFLHPPRDSGYAGNNASCVLRVSNAAGAALLTGDIERHVERRLAGEIPDRLRSDLVLAPHHGSRSSSGPDFVRATAARYVVYTAGWANRYGFPAIEVVQRWQAAGAVAFDTATGGTLSFHFAAHGRLSAPIAHRDARRRFWHHDSGSAVGPHAVSSAD